MEVKTANANGVAFEWPGGKGTLQVFGTFDTATVTLQGSLNGVDWSNIPSGAHTADAIVAFEAGNILVRAVLSSVGAGTILNAFLVGTSDR